MASDSDGSQAPRMEGKNDRKIALLLASGHTQREVAERLGVSRRTIERRAATPGVRRAISRFRAASTSAGAGALARHYKEAVAVLVELMRGGSRWDTTRLAAASRIIDAAHRANEQGEMVERLDELESLLAEVRGNGEESKPEIAGRDAG